MTSCSLSGKGVPVFGGTFCLLRGRVCRSHGPLKHLYHLPGGLHDDVTQ